MRHLCLVVVKDFRQVWSADTKMLMLTPS